MPKRILFVDHHAELGGGEIALLEIIKNLDKNKFSLFVVLGNDGFLKDELKNLNVEVIIDKLPDYFRELERDPAQHNNLVVFIKSALCLSKFIKNIKSVILEKCIDTVYINSIKSALYAIPAARQAKRKIIWHLHDCLSKDFYPSWIIPLIIFFTNKADRVICVSNTVKDYFIKAGGEKEKVSVLYNGVDTTRFNPAISTEFIRRELNISEEKIVSVISRLEPWKGQDIFIEAAKIICAKRSGVIFLIAGDPIFGFNKYEAELKAMAEHLKLKDKIYFLGFRYDAENIYAVSDIITHSSTRPEPFGRDIIEAMACARPVISTKLGAPEEIITDGKDGFLIQPNNPEILAYKILELLDNPQLIKTIGVNARKKSEEHFDIAKIAKQIEQVI